MLNDTWLKVIVPPAATSGPITLVTAGGIVNSDRNFTVLQPHILGFFPDQGAVGSTVLLVGERLGTTQEVRFNGMPATNFQVYFNFLLTAVVPAGATTGKISVVLQGGGQATSRWTFLVVDKVPAIAAHAPSIRKREPAAAERTLVWEPAAYPNPFTTGVTIPLALKAPAAVQLTIYSETGQLIQHLSTDLPGASRQQLEWDGRDSQGQPVATGIYFYRLLVNGKVRSGMLLKTAVLP